MDRVLQVACYFLSYSIISTRKSTQWTNNLSFMINYFKVLLNFFIKTHFCQTHNSFFFFCHSPLFYLYLFRGRPKWTMGQVRTEKPTDLQFVAIRLTIRLTYDSNSNLTCREGGERKLRPLPTNYYTI